MESYEYILDSTSNKTDYFSMKNINIDIPFTSLDKITIISYTCDNSVDNWDIINNSVIFHISLVFKILYTTSSSNSINIFKYKCYCYEVINLPLKIDGFELKKIDIKKRLKPLCTLLSISFLDLQSCFISFSLIFLCEVKVLHSLSILYIIKDTEENNYLYSSNIFLNNFIQLTFTNRSFEHICFSSYNDTIFYSNNNTIYNYSLLTYKEVSSFTVNSLGWFSNIAPNKFIIYKNTLPGIIIILLDILKNTETVLYKYDKESTCCSFNFTCNKLSFILCENTKKQLIVLDTLDNDIFKMNCNFDNIFMNPSGNFILTSINSTLRIININGGSINDILIPIDNFILKDIVFFSDNIAIIYGTCNNTSYILSFNIENSNFDQLLEGDFIISSLDIDNRGNLIFTSNELGLFNVYSLEPGKAPKLALKLFTNNLYLLIRK